MLNDSLDLPAYVKPSEGHSDDDKFDVMIAFLTESHLDSIGGYPHDWGELGLTIIVASLDPAKDHARTMIEYYDRPGLIEWYDEAVRDWRKAAAEDDACEFLDALFDTMPSDEGES